MREVHISVNDGYYDLLITNIIYEDGTVDVAFTESRIACIQRQLNTLRASYEEVGVK